MKAMFVTFFTLIFAINSGAQSIACVGLFTEPTPRLDNLLFQSKRLSIVQTTTDKVPSKLIIEVGAFSENINEATIEIMRMLVQNSEFILEDKNVLTKNKFTLGIPLKNGYFFEATYESKSNNHPRFILQDKVILVTPTGKEIKVTDELLHADELKIKKSEFTLANYADTGLEIHLKIPLVVEGALLGKLTEMASYFEYFKKDEIARIVQNDSMGKIKALFRLRKAKDIFVNVLIKQPFKSLISGAIMFAAINGQTFFPHKAPPETMTQSPAAISQTFLKKTINNFPVPENQVQLRKELAALQVKALSLLKTKSYSGLGPYEISLDARNVFSREQNLFVHYRMNRATNQMQTHLVFSSDVSNGGMQGLQFFSVEVNPKEFVNLIEFIQKQGLLATETNLPKKNE